jgi:hypothetical protein
MNIFQRIRFWNKKRLAKKRMLEERILVNLDIPQALSNSGLDFSGVELDGLIRGYRSKNDTGLPADRAYAPGQEVFTVEEIITGGKTDVALVISPIFGDVRSAASFNKDIRLRIDAGKPPKFVAIPEIGADNKVISFNRIVFSL